jgi:hypothetical protein
MFASNPVRELPPGYVEVKHVVLTEGRTLLWLNVLSLLPLLAALGLMAVWTVLVSPIRANVPPTDFSLPWWLGVILVLVLVLPLHELIHGIAITITGHPATYGIKLDKGVLYATSDKALFRRDEYLLVAIAPLAVITLLCLVLSLFAPEWLYSLLVMAVVLNAGGAIGDIWFVVVLLRYPRRVLVRDEQDGFRIYDNP